MLPDRFTTPRLILRPVAPEDGGPIFDTDAQDEDVTRYLTWRPHRSRDDTAAYIARCIATPPDDTRIYVLTGRDDGVLLGAFDLRRPAAHRLEFGYALARSWWGQGLMTEALTEVARWAISQPTVVRIGAACDVKNLGSARVMEKAGLIREGLLHRWLVLPNTGDEPRDCFIYALTR